jgi:hypothetical protein
VCSFGDGRKNDEDEPEGSGGRRGEREVILDGSGRVRMTVTSPGEVRCVVHAVKSRWYAKGYRATHSSSGIGRNPDQERVWRFCLPDIRSRLYPGLPRTYTLMSGSLPVASCPLEPEATRPAVDALLSCLAIASCIFISPTISHDPSASSKAVFAASRPPAHRLSPSNRLPLWLSPFTKHSSSQ